MPSATATLEDDEQVAESVHGILQCLRFLAQEAADLNLQRTLSAIERAAETITREAGAGAPAGVVLH